MCFEVGDFMFETKRNFSIAVAEYNQAYNRLIRHVQEYRSKWEKLSDTYYQYVYKNICRLSEQMQKKQNDSYYITTYTRKPSVNSGYLEETYSISENCIFRDNFLNLDIYYKYLTVEEIYQQPAFEFLSLLSEVCIFYVTSEW